MKVAQLINRRESIILAAIDEINEHGIQAVSTREMAKKQGVCERIIFKHFPTKNDLLAAVLEHFSKYDQATFQTVRSKKMMPLDAITFFFESFSTYYENYPAITAIGLSYDALLRNPELSGKIKNIFSERELFIKEQIEKAREMGLVSPDTDSESFADITLGNFMRLCLKWRMHEYNFSLKEKSLSTLQIIIKAYKP